MEQWKGKILKDAAFTPSSCLFVFYLPCGKQVPFCKGPSGRKVLLSWSGISHNLLFWTRLPAPGSTRFIAQSVYHLFVFLRNRKIYSVRSPKQVNTEITVAAQWCRCTHFNSLNTWQLECGCSLVQRYSSPFSVPDVLIHFAPQVYHSELYWLFQCLTGEGSPTPCGRQVAEPWLVSPCHWEHGSSQIKPALT